MKNILNEISKSIKAAATKKELVVSTEIIDADKNDAILNECAKAFNLILEKSCEEHKINSNQNIGITSCRCDITKTSNIVLSKIKTDNTMEFFVTIETPSEHTVVYLNEHDFSTVVHKCADENAFTLKLTLYKVLTSEEVTRVIENNI